MCASLAVLGLADLGSSTEKQTQVFGMGLLVVAVFSDAVVPNLQEKLLRGMKAPRGVEQSHLDARRGTHDPRRASRNKSCVEAFLHLQLQVPLGEMVLLSNFGSFVVVLVYVFYTGELFAAVAYCRAHVDAAALLLLQALAGYAGLRCYLSVIKNLSGVGGGAWIVLELASVEASVRLGGRVLDARVEGSIPASIRLATHRSPAF